MYRALPENRKARAGDAGLGNNIGNLKSWKHEDSQTLPTIQAPVFTAVPLGVRTWAVKAVAPDGSESRRGRFVSRLEALGAAVLIAEQFGGEVAP